MSTTVSNGRGEMIVVLAAERDSEKGVEVGILPSAGKYSIFFPKARVANIIAALEDEADV